MRNILISLLALALAGGCTLFVDFESQDKTKETNCSDGIDNNENGATDCEDPDCWFASNCTGEVCDNGIDDDGDDFFDCEDPECYEHPNCSTSGEDCMNGIDDDGDGQIDCDDSDCTDSFECMDREICHNGDDDDFDGLVDCDDDECWGLEGCNYPDGEYDCGNAVDDDMDEMVDCEDPDCNDSILCLPEVVPCVSFTPFQSSFGQIFYYTDIYQSGATPTCTNGHYCGIRPELSLIPHCYPQVTSGLAMAYQPCTGKTCGPGLVCLPPGPMEPELCLPLCAPDYNDQCIGGEGICFRYWTTNYDNHISRNVELWTCGRPICDPMNLITNGCNPSTAGCYPATDLFGDAACHNPAGSVPLDEPCPQGDPQCLPGHICRDDANTGESVCKKLCVGAEDCSLLPATACYRNDSRQFFGYCR